MYPQATIIPYALGSSEQAAKLNITQNPACSSILTPDYDVLRKFPVIKWFEVTDHIDVRLTPYSTVAKEMSLKTPDFVKLDVQGFESEVLRGFGPVLNEVLCIELETHIKPIYKGQKTLPEITDQLEASGFFLRHLATVGIFEDEVVEFNAFFIRRPELIRTETDRKKVKFWCDLHQFPNGAYFADWDKQR